MQKRVVGDEQEHVVLGVMVHIPVQVVIDWVYVDGAAIEPVVEHVLGKPIYIKRTRVHRQVSL